VPSYLQDAIADTIRALDRWTLESQRAQARDTVSLDA